MAKAAESTTGDHEAEGPCEATICSRQVAALVLLVNWIHIFIRDLVTNYTKDIMYLIELYLYYDTPEEQTSVRASQLGL